MSERFRKIIEENRRWEKEFPYNFCDRWCERCPYERQMRCSIYQDELEQKIACIAHGREPDDPEVIAEIFHRQVKEAGEDLEITEEDLMCTDEIDDNPDWIKIRQHIESARNDPLESTVRQYSRKAHGFLRETFYKDRKANPDLLYDFETVAWYHTLLPAKLHRALCGFHEPMTEGDVSLNDAVAQFAVCKTAILKSCEALRKISLHCPKESGLIVPLIALLQNILSRIEVLERQI